MTAVQAFVKLIRRSTLKRKQPVRAGNAQGPWPLEPWQSGSETKGELLGDCIRRRVCYDHRATLAQVCGKPVDAGRIALPPVWFDVFHSVPHFLRVYRLSVG
jgi:hypothetical protein